MALPQSKHIQLSAEDEAQLEGGGGVAKETQQDRDRTMKMFNGYVTAETSRTVQVLIGKEDKSEEEHKKDLELLSYVFSKYFWTLRVDVMEKPPSVAHGFKPAAGSARQPSQTAGSASQPSHPAGSASQPSHPTGSASKPTVSGSVSQPSQASQPPGVALPVRQQQSVPLNLHGVSYQPTGGCASQPAGSASPSAWNCG